MARNFLGTHRTKIIRGKRLTLTPSKLEKGMIVEAKYKPVIDGKMGALKKYMLLILNPGYKGKAKEKMIHCLTLNNFPPAILNQLAEDIGLMYIPKYQKMVGLDIPKMIMDESAQRFYSSKIKKDIAKKFGASYRTMKVASFSGIELINYNWDKSILLKFFPKEDIEEE